MLRASAKFPCGQPTDHMHVQLFCTFYDAPLDLPFIEMCCRCNGYLFFYVSVKPTII